MLETLFTWGTKEVVPFKVTQITALKTTHSVLCFVFQANILVTEKKTKNSLSFRSGTGHSTFPHESDVLRAHPPTWPPYHDFPPCSIEYTLHPALNIGTGCKTWPAEFSNISIILIGRWKRQGNVMVCMCSYRYRWKDKIQTTKSSLKAYQTPRQHCTVVYEAFWMFISNILRNKTNFSCLTLTNTFTICICHNHNP